MLDRAREVDRESVAGLLHRSVEATRDQYFLASDYMGLFVLVPNVREGAAPWTLVTYIRLMPSQQAEARKLWPQGRG